MKIKVQIVIESDGGDTKAVENITCLDRGLLRPEDLELTLDEAKGLLESVQRTLVEQQVGRVFGATSPLPLLR